MDKKYVCAEATILADFTGTVFVYGESGELETSFDLADLPPFKSRFVDIVEISDLANFALRVHIGRMIADSVKRADSAA